MRSLIAAVSIWCLAACAWAGDRDVERLAQALRLDEVIAVLRDEGLSHGRLLDQDMLEGAGGAYFADQVSHIYDAAGMRAVLTEAMATRMTPAAVAASIGFFESDLGRRIIALELSARQAFSDPDIEATAVARMEALAEDDPHRRLIRDYVEANELIERNVDGIQSTDFSFYLGLVEGGAMGRDDEGYLSGLLDNRDAVRADTESWAMSFHLMAYHPLDAGDMRANIAFSRSPDGQELNVALFGGFDEMYDDIYYRLGRLVAQAMSAADL